MGLLPVNYSVIQAQASGILTLGLLHLHVVGFHQVTKVSKPVCSTFPPLQATINVAQFELKGLKKESVKGREINQKEKIIAKKKRKN